MKKPMDIRTMPTLALRGLVLFPNMILNFDVGREKSVLALGEVMEKDRLIFLVMQKNINTDNPEPEDLCDVGVVAEVKQIFRPTGEGMRVLVEGKYRAKAAGYLSASPFFVADVYEHPLKPVKSPSGDLVTALVRTVKELFDEYCFLSPRMPKDIPNTAMSSEDPVYLAEFIMTNISVNPEIKQTLLTESNPIKRLEFLAETLESENNILGIENVIYDRVRDQVDKNQKEYYLREQLKAISYELGEEDEEVEEAETYEKKIKALKLPKKTEEKFLYEAGRIAKMPGNSHETAVVRSYLDTCLDLPWNTHTTDKIDLAKAESRLEKDHYGMKRVKERILELLAVRKLAPDIKGQIICLAGPPGVGKTSVAKSIAKAMGRKYVRISLGGVRDEADIRGHRKTYVGAMPGRIINAIKQAGSSNPLMLLDEVDKLGNDFKGDPASALLEVLDAEQNSTFRDHYIEADFDLSNVLFIATANDLSEIPEPLLDRMEVIELSGYTAREKFEIAKRYLVPKQRTRHGIKAGQLKISDDGLYAVIEHYTREAGVRRLEREIASLSRKVAKKIADGTAPAKTVIGKNNIKDYLGPHKYKIDPLSRRDEVGVVNGLAWTSVGGEILQVEVAVLDGTGKIELTGSLGTVMKESAQAAVSYMRSVADIYKISSDFYKTKDIHIHFPEGAVPKDGPSAGTAICSALASALSGMPANGNIAMTGEISLRGRVLPIGGLREKTMAAYRMGIGTVIIPKDNLPDLEEIDAEVKDAVRFVPVEHVSEVLELILVKESAHARKAPPVPIVEISKPSGHGVLPAGLQQ